MAQPTRRAIDQTKGVLTVAETQVAVETNGVHTKEEIDAAYLEAHRKHGYITAEGKVSNAKRAEAACKVLLKHQVNEPNDRRAKAIQQHDLVAELFPDIIHPDDWEQAEDPDLAKYVYGKVKNAVWGDVRVDRAGKVQNLLGSWNGEAPYVLCQTVLTNAQIPAAYVTRDAR